MWDRSEETIADIEDVKQNLTTSIMRSAKISYQDREAPTHLKTG